MNWQHVLEAATGTLGVLVAVRVFRAVAAQVVMAGVRRRLHHGRQQARSQSR